MTPNDRRMLEHLADGHSCYGRHMARHLWPDSAAWSRPVGHKHAVIPGKSMPGNAGRLMRRAAALGYVETSYSATGQTKFSITPAGRLELEEAP